MSLLCVDLCRIKYNTSKTKCNSVQQLRGKNLTMFCCETFEIMYSTQCITAAVIRAVGATYLPSGSKYQI